MVGEGDSVLSLSNVVEIDTACELDPYPKGCESSCNAGWGLKGLKNVVGVPGVCNGVR